MKNLFLTTLCCYPLITQAASEGVLEIADCNGIKGWAWNSTQPNSPVKVDIFNGPTKVTTIIAKKFRQDLLNAGKGNGEHGFIYHFGAELKNGATHKLSVKFNGTSTQLSGSPKTTSVCIGALNDTGWQTCGNNSSNGLKCTVTGFEGQDGDYGRDAKVRAGTLKKKGGGWAGFDFTKIANNGTKLPATAVLGTEPKNWACTLDNTTGLMWEIKTNDNGLRDQDYDYSWYNPDPNTNGGYAGKQNGGICGGAISCDTHGYVQAINAQGLCGKKDWRLPTKEELRSVVRYDGSYPSLDSEYFPNTNLSNYAWSSSTIAYNTNEAWMINFDDGDNIPINKSMRTPVWLVRGGQ